MVLSPVTPCFDREIDSLDGLPDDVLYDILCHSSVRDILALRQVSRKFYHLSHHRPIWVNAYKTCPILLPPGPFSYQSAVDLEQALKTGHLLEANWTSPYPCPISRQTFVVPSLGSLFHMKLVGRYLLITGHPMLRCFDLESKTEELVPIAVYDSVETSFDCVVDKHSVVDSGGCQLLCALKGEGMSAVTLLRLRISQGSAKFELMKEVRLPRPIHSIRIIGDFLVTRNASHGPMLLHIPTFQMYDVPPCDHGSRIEYAITSNHLLCYSFSVSEEVLELFPLPRGAAQPNDDETPSVHILTRSHKCIHNYGIGHGIILLAERHNNDDDSTHYTVITVGRPSFFPRLGFLEISLMSDLVTTTWTEAVFEGESRWTPSKLHGSARGGVSRLVVSTNHAEVIAFTVSEDEDGKRVVRCKPVVVDKKLEKMRIWHGFIFEGVQGRICSLLSSGPTGRIEVISFV